MWKKHKSIIALCLTALLGCLVPMGTMKAAEDILSELGVSISASVAEYHDDGTITKVKDLSISEELNRKIDYVYIDSQDKILNIFAEFLTPSESSRSFYCYLDTSGADTSLSREALESIDNGWVEFYGNHNISLDKDGKYVLYVKIVQDDKAYYAVSQGIVVDSRIPSDGVIGANGDYSLESGKEYRLGDGTYAVNGDATVYQGGSTFYIKESGTYTFTKY